MTESNQLQTTENNNTAVIKMEPPPLPTALASSSSAADSPTNEQLHHQILQQQQQYALKWNDFHSSILSSFRHLRDEEDFVDVTLACDQRSFTAHKVVLSACSPYFRKLLKANPCEHPIVILRDVCSDDVENLLSFMYNGEVNVSYENLSDFLKTAHLLQIRGLADINSSCPTSFDSAAKSLPVSLKNTITNLSNNNNINIKIPKNSSNNNGNEIHNFQASPNQANLNNIGASACGPSSFPVPSASNMPSTFNVNNFTASSNLGGTPNTPAIQELKASSASPVRKSNSNKANNSWDIADADRNSSHLTPPPQKRIKSADLFRAQHGISPERLLIDREFPVAGQHPLTRERKDRSRDTSRDRERNIEMRDSLLSQALENSGGPANQKLHADLNSLHAQSAGEDSNSSDTEPSDRGDGNNDGTVDSMNGSLDGHQRSFPNAFLGLQGIPGLLPGTSSGINTNDFVTRRSLEMRVRATDPRPCPKCGKIYRSAHTLRTHLEDKHTVCPGYRCVLCGTVAKSRNSLHSHMSRQHRGISTKDLPVLPMPSPFDPELASRLLAKAGVKISAAELRARASPTNGSSTAQTKLDITNSNATNDEADDSDDDPEDLTTGTGSFAINSTANNTDLNRYHESLLSNFSHANSTISRIRNEAAVAALGQQKDITGVQNPGSSAPAQTLLDTYLQFITENSFGMGISQEHAAAALHAAKMAQLSAMGHGLDKLPAGLLPPQFDLSKFGVVTNFGNNAPSTSIEPIIMRTDAVAASHSPKSETSTTNPTASNFVDKPEAMDLGNNTQPSVDIRNSSSDAEGNISEDESVQNS